MAGICCHSLVRGSHHQLMAKKKTWACHEHAHPPVRPSPHPPLRAPLSSLPPHALCEGSDISFFEQCSMATSTTGLCEVHTYYVHVDVYVNVCMYVM